MIFHVGIRQITELDLAQFFFSFCSVSGGGAAERNVCEKLLLAAAEAA